MVAMVTLAGAAVPTCTATSIITVLSERIEAQLAAVMSTVMIILPLPMFQLQPRKVACSGRCRIS